MRGLELRIPNTLSQETMFIKPGSELGCVNASFHQTLG